MFGSVFYDYLEGPWDQAKGYLREHLEQLNISLNAQWASVFDANGTLNVGAVANSSAPVPSYVANTGPNKAPRWDKVDVAIGVKNRLRYVNFTPATDVSLLLGRRSSVAGNWEEITLGPGLIMAGTTLEADPSFIPNGWKPLSTGEEPIQLVSDGLGAAIMVTFTP